MNCDFVTNDWIKTNANLPMLKTANRNKARDGHDTSNSNVSSQIGLNPLSAN